MINVTRHRDVHTNKTFIYFEDKSIRAAFGKGGDSISVFKKENTYEVMLDTMTLCKLDYRGGKPKINDEREIWQDKQASQLTTN